MNDDDFEKLSEQTEFAIVERQSDGTLLIGELNGAMRSSASSEINCQFSEWLKMRRLGHGLMWCSFFLADGSCLSPSCSYVTNDQLARLTREERHHFLRLAPAFVIELLSASDRLAAAERKVESWIANGVQIGWLVDPYAKQVHVYSPGATPRIETGSAVAGSGPVEGFVLDLAEVWSCFE